ncbi:MAG: plastocyanin [Roseateles sp.]|uniref:plastocyanin n=1 Tax=Roseateles sp. TaxID=1971397 RepID=UPI0040375098
MRAFFISALMLAAAASQAADLTVTVLDRNGKPLADAVVLVDSSVTGPRPAPTMEANVSQEKLRFIPAVTVVGLNARVSFNNLDTWDHHVILGVMGPGGVYVDPGLNTQFRLAGRLAGKAPASDSKVLSQPGPYLLACHIHSSMRGHVYVSDTPWAKLGGIDGKVLLQALPEGQARVRIWHPDQLVEGAATAVLLAAGANAVTVKTQIVAARRQRVAPAADASYPGL